MKNLEYRQNSIHAGIVGPGKTIVFGHWHCSFGHSRYENDGGKFDNDPNFAPYYSDATGFFNVFSCQRS